MAKTPKYVREAVHACVKMGASGWSGIAVCAVKHARSAGHKIRNGSRQYTAIREASRRAAGSIDRVRGKRRSSTRNWPRRARLAYE